MDIQLKKKKEKKNLSVENRAAILQDLESGVSVHHIAAKYGVTSSAILMIRKRKENVLKAKKILENCDGNITKKRYPTAEENMLDTKLFEWLKERRSAGVPISGHLLKSQALFYNHQLSGNKNFKASNGWLDRFKKRHGLYQPTVRREKLSAARIASEKFKENINNIRTVTGTSLDFIYNCNETGLYYKMMPNTTLVSKGEVKVEGRKKPNDRLTMMLCTNASGTHKLPLFVIGKNMPRCLKGIKNLPVIFEKQVNAWMTCDLMRTWYSTIFIPEVQKKYNLDNNPEIKIILIMDNAGCHPPAKELNNQHASFSVLYLPPNVTSLIQPLDQGIIEQFKRLYRKFLVERIIIEDESKSGNVDTYLKSLNLLDCCNICAIAWNQISQDNIRNCWESLIPSEENTISTHEIQSVNAEDLYRSLKISSTYKSLTLEHIREWLNIDADDNGRKLQVADDSIMNADEELNDTISYNDQECTPSDSILNSNNVTFVEAFSAMNTLFNWYQINGGSETGLQHLQELYSEMAERFSNEYNKKKIKYLK